VEADHPTPTLITDGPINGVRSSHLVGRRQHSGTDPTSHDHSRTHRERTITFPSDRHDAPLPLGEAGWVGHVREDIFGTAGYVDGLHNRGHLTACTERLSAMGSSSSARR
jgi:hypothetical protein